MIKNGVKILKDYVFWAAAILALDLAACLFFFNNQQQVIGWRLLISPLAVLLAGTSLFYFTFKKNILPQIRRLNGFSLGLLLAVLSLTGLFFLTFGGWPLNETQVFERHLKISVPAENKTGVSLARYKTNYGEIEAGAFTPTGNWRQGDNNLWTSLSSPADLTWQGYTRDTVLTFRGSPQGGEVTVQWDDRSVTYDLTESQDKEIVVHDGHPVNNLEKSIMAGLITPIIIFVLLGLMALLMRLTDGLQDDRRAEWKWRPVDLLPLWREAAWGLAGMALFLWLTRQSGLWVLSDSVDYLSAARHLLAGQGYIGMDNDLYVWWPPLLPGLLALFHGGSTLEDMLAVRGLYLLMAGGTLAVYSYIVRKMTGGKMLYWLGMGLLLSSISFWTVSVTMMSEALFLFFEALFWLYVLRFSQYNRLADLLLIVLAVVLMSLTRYAGGFFAAGLGLLLCFWGGGSLIKRLARGAAGFTLAITPLGVWLVRNYLTKGVWTGKRPPPVSTLPENISGMLEVIGRWFQPCSHWIIGLVVVLFLTLGVVLWVGRIRGHKSAARMGWGLLGMVWIYMASLMVSFSTTNLAPLNGERHYSPLFFPMLLLGLMILNEDLGHFQQPILKKAAQTAVGLALAAGLIFPAMRVVDLGRTPLENTETGFSMYAYWGHPAIEEAIRLEDQIGGLTWTSNCKKCLYYAGNRWSVEFYEPMLLKVKEPPLAVVWFEDLHDSGGRPTDETGMKAWLEQVHGPGLDIETLSHKGSGVVYVVERKN